MNIINDPNPEMDPRVNQMLQSLQQVEPRDTHTAAHARSNFLSEVEQLKPSVSISPPTRLNIWESIKNHFWLFKRKENKTVFNFIMSIMVVMSVVFGGGAVTVAAAQSAVPEGLLYPVKTWTEEVRLGWEKDPVDKAGLAIQLTTRRAEEIQSMLMSKGEVPEPVLAQFQNQHQLALKLAANLPDEQVPAVMAQYREQIQLQEQIMAQLQLKDGTGDQIRTRLQTMLMTQAQIALQGSEDPAWLREQIKAQTQEQTQAGNAFDDEETPGQGNGQQLQNGDPDDEKGNGPGDPQTMQQGQPEDTGNGPGTCDADCQQEQEQQQYQNQNEQQQQNQNGEQQAEPAQQPQQNSNPDNSGNKGNGK
jgi:hypothetical protein